MRKTTLSVLMLFAFGISFAQMPRQTATPQQIAAYERFQELYDSITPQQKSMFFTHVKHIYDPEVVYVQPGVNDDAPPADAIILFDGTDINKEWEESGRAPDGSFGVKPTVTWVINDGAMESSQGSGSVRTKRTFTDFQLHIEWKTPTVVTGKEVPGYPGQYRGNSGITFAGGYELQILDSYENPTYSNGQAGAIYMQYAPLVNVSRKPGEWQSFDIIYTSPRFKDSTAYFTPPKITVFHNGVLIQNNVSIEGPTVSPGITEYNIIEHLPGPFSLQQHGDAVAFRNIWIREL